MTKNILTLLRHFCYSNDRISEKFYVYFTLIGGHMSYLAVQNPLIHGAARTSVFPLDSFLYDFMKQLKTAEWGRMHGAD